MKFPIFQVDAFTDRVFAGNPAAVVLLQDWLPDELLQGIAMENNLSETAFLVPRDGFFDLRWFTPKVEVDLCGHATLASAHVLFEQGKASGGEVVFETKGGTLTVRQEDDLLAMDFPARPAQRIADSPRLSAALGAAPRELHEARDLLAVFGSQAEVQALAPDFAALAALDAYAVIVTAPGEACDFVSRFFAPAVGVPEDPVTGSAHCTLAPYWSARLDKPTLHARQVSARGGELFCEHRGDRVLIKGRAAGYLRGEIHV